MNDPAIVQAAAAAAAVDDDELIPILGNGNGAEQQQQQQQQPPRPGLFFGEINNNVGGDGGGSTTSTAAAARVSRLYFVLSALGAILAIVSSSSSTFSSGSSNHRVAVSQHNKFPSMGQGEGRVGSGSGSNGIGATTAAAFSSSSSSSAADATASSSGTISGSSGPGLIAAATSGGAGARGYDSSSSSSGQSRQQKSEQQISSSSVDFFSDPFFWFQYTFVSSSNPNVNINNNEEDKKRSRREKRDRDEGKRIQKESSISGINNNNNKSDNNKLPPWLRWLSFPWGLGAADDTDAATTTCDSSGDDNSFLLVLSSFDSERLKSLLLPPYQALLNRDNASVFTSVLDPTLLRPSSTTFTDLIDKILTSTPRLLAIANLLLALTYLLHAAVADWFLGNNNNNNNQQQQQQTDWTFAHSTSSSGGRERLGGYLVFKLLLISAVLAPDTLDLLILLSWYTLLSFLRSLAHLCATVSQRTRQSGVPPRKGVFQLLLVVLMSDVLAAAFCVALFHGAGFGMVLLLTCDCALLAVDVLCHLLTHVAQVLDEEHGHHLSLIETEQLRLSTASSTVGNMYDTSNATATGPGESTEEEEVTSRLQFLDRRMEVVEQQHTRRWSILDGIIFGLQLLSGLLLVGHYVHIWSLHGVQFTLIDGVLALHLHSALSSASRKIQERRNLSRISRDLDGMFDNASELDLRKASAAGDVCCICLGRLSVCGGQKKVKKVGCGHLYHLSCLKQVVERARSMEMTRCPLCRANVIDGSRQPQSQPGNVNDNNNVRQTADGNNNNNNNNNTAATGTANTTRQQQERALFRFSSEEVFPAWLQLPAFSFEVVRRPTRTQVAVGPTNNPVAATRDQGQQQQQQQQHPDGANDDDNNNNNNIDDEVRGSRNVSMLRRLLILAGAVNMDPDEEAAALEQLVDMFPQYVRGDLLRELRARGSAEDVAESILAGSFTGIPRGGGVIAPVVE